MSAANTNSNSRQYLDVLKVAKFTQKPVSNEKAGESIVEGVRAALSGFGPRTVRQEQKLKSKAAAQLSSCVPAALRCAAWLVAARDTNPAVKDVFWQTVHRCLYLAYCIISRVEVGPDLVRGVLQQTANIPGVTAWLPVLAQELVSNPAATAAAAAAGHHVSKWITTEELVVCVWGALLDGCCKHSRNAQAAPATWLHPAMVRLADAVLQRPTTELLAQPVLTAPLLAGSSGASPLAHPWLCTAAGRPPDPALGGQVAVLQEEFWWRALATCCQAVAAAGAPPLGGLPYHPGHYCPPSFKGRGYSRQTLSSASTDQALNLAWQALHVLLVAQLWDVWPWQLQQSGCGGQGSAGTGSAGARPKAATITSSSSGGGRGDGASSASSGSNNSDSNSVSKASSASQQSVTSKASSGKDVAVEQVSVPAGPSQPRKQLLPTSWEHDVMVWPLLPEQGPSSLQMGHGSNPVTLQQLQLATYAMMYADALGAPTAGFLLALLLQRADPSLRVEFLGGPGGTTLLATCQYWGYRYVTPLILALGVPTPTFYVLDKPSRCSVPSLLAALRGQSIEGSQEWIQVGAGPSSALLLMWCYLELVPGWEHGGAWDAMLHHTLMTTPHHYASCQRLNGAAPECLILRGVPWAAVRFARGCAPTPQLLGTLEALLRDDKVFHINLARCIATFVNAAVAWLNCSSAHVRASGAAGKSSSSSSSGVSSAGPDASGSGCSDNSSSDSLQESSSACAPGRQDTSEMRMSRAEGGQLDQDGILQALAGLAVTWGTKLQREYISTDPDRHHGKTELPLGMALDVLPCSAAVAGDLLHLAAQQLTVPGLQALPALQLVAAALRLAGQCAQAAHTTFRRLEVWVHLPAGNNTPAAAAAKAAQQDSIPSRRRQAAMLLEPVEASLEVLQGGLLALQQVQHVAGQQQQQQYGVHQVGASAGSSDKGTSGASGSGSDCGSTLPTITTSSSNGSAAGIPEVVVNSRMLARARSLHQACRPRVQLLGCGNLCCTTVTGPSAEGLVAGCKGGRCGGCRVARYCSPACQEEDWEQHRRVCRRLAAVAPRLHRGVGS